MLKNSETSTMVKSPNGKIQTDFGVDLRRKLPRIYFDVAPVVVDDALTTGTKYDALVKFSDNMMRYAVAVLLNDPTSSFEYLDTHRGNDWQKIIGNFEAAAASFDQGVDLFLPESEDSALH